MIYQVSKLFRLLFVFICFVETSAAQNIFKGVVVDSISRQHLPFSSIHLEDKKTGVISDIKGRFSIATGDSKTLRISYSGYNSKIIQTAGFHNGDTIMLSRKNIALKNVIIGGDNLIKRIIDRAISNKGNNNPDNYKNYECNIYYKMAIDVQFSKDSIQNNKSRNKNKVDTVNEPLPDFLTEKSYLMFSETYTKRLYRSPQQVQEIMLASRFSGLKNTYFTNLVTDVLPFHIYNDYIKLNNQDYTNPIAKGWQNKYSFSLEDIIYSAGDTVYLLVFEPKKGALFNALRGTVFINKRGYAISHMIGSTADTSKGREISFEQLYNTVGDKWFPKELNYTFKIKFPDSTIVLANGHSIIDSVSLARPLTFKINKAHPIIISDSVDLRTPSQWERYRSDTLSRREVNTYVVLDSFSQKNHLEKIIQTFTKLSINRIPFGKVDLDIYSLLRSNEYEGLRVGLGLFTNNKISKYFSIGGWGAYGFKDQKFKGGGSFTFFPRKQKDNWIKFLAQYDYQKPGEVFIFEGLNKPGETSTVLREPDATTKYQLEGQLQLGYTEINPQVTKKIFQSLAVNPFNFNGKVYNNFQSTEYNIGIRYAYGEKRIPVLDYYIPFFTKYPIFYSRLSYGTIQSNDYSASYIRAVAAITYTKHINRWGLDAIRIEGGYIKELDSKPLPKSFLLSTNGVRINAISRYYSNGFQTMSPDQYFSESYFNIFYKHDFDHYLWDIKRSKPFISVAHNVALGGLSKISGDANGGLNKFDQVYQESGFIVNQFYKLNIHITDISLNAGVFYHWGASPDIRTNTTFVFGVSSFF